MAEVTAMRNNALPYPMYGLAWTIVFPHLDADGDLAPDVTTPDTERSLNGDTFADCTNEAVNILAVGGGSGTGNCYLTLTAAEMTADVVVVQSKSATAGMKTTIATLYPRKLVQFKASATSAGGAAGSITFDSGASTIDGFYAGMVIVATLDGAIETRICTGYVGSTKVASVTPNWNTTPDSDDTFIVYLTPEMSMFTIANVLAWNSAAIASPHTAGYPVVTVKDGTGTGEIDTTSGGVLVAAIAANAITAASMNSDASAEIADAVWDEDATGHQTGGTFGQAIGDPGADTTTMYAAVVTGAAGTHIAADIIAIKAETASILTDTAEIGAAGAGLTAIDLPDQTMNITGNITGNLSGSVGSVTGNVGGTINGLTATALKDFFDTDSATTYASAVAGSVVKEIADNAGGASLTAADIADAVWEEAIADHSGTAGSTAEKLAAAASAGDPWSTALPGAYGSGTAGKIVGDNINATISSRATQTSVDTIDDFLDLEIAAILADTNELQTDWADGGRLDVILDARASQASVNTIDGIVDDILVDTAEIGAAGAGLTNINLPNQTMDIVGSITGNLSGSVGSVTGAVGSVTGAVGSVTGNVGGNVTGSVGSVAAGGIAAASFAANAIAAATLDPDVTTELQNGLATAANLATVAGYLDTEVAAILADTNELQTDLVNGGRLDLLIDAIKAKTDSLTFTVAGQVDANIQYVNDIQVTGDGEVGTEWGPV